MKCTFVRQFSQNAPPNDSSVWGGQKSFLQPAKGNLMHAVAWKIPSPTHTRRRVNNRNEFRRSRPACLPAVCEEWKYNFTKCNLSISTLLLKVFQCWYDFSSAELWGRTTAAEGETFEGDWRGKGRWTISSITESMTNDC